MADRSLSARTECPPVPPWSAHHLCGTPRGGRRPRRNPICPDCYDYAGAVLHNAHTPELWRRTTIYLHRQLAGVLGLTQAETREVVRLSFCRVAEYQRRGVIHLHAIVRADGTDDGLPPVSADELIQACLRTVRSVEVHHPRGETTWGTEVDVQVLDREDGRAAKVASYVAKYATKSTVDSGVLDRPIQTDEDLDARPLSPHLRRMVETAWHLGNDPELRHLHLRRYAHALGYNGQFLTKSRRYSSTFANRVPNGPSGGKTDDFEVSHLLSKLPLPTRSPPNGKWSASAGPVEAKCCGPRIGG